ncbi:hypothetical protein [Nostoc sp. ATCC 53789]|uniref:hypothetical protein n=1 Tax=Nostoc sp. ATCC 53789 TaxID=76335 RepID=UPI000E01D72F|nr:hypothetical protein [Nostoc sp. ATCC 53789]QHG20611.1 hypothetical protein GJB62_32525 [Nostoc sp. ATCC 53789]RCJ33256.1 hypothetical protein A6V25_34600 [Nostoc sp. ATCC 53789]
MPSATSTQEISSPYRQEETQSYDLQEWEGYSWVIFRFEVRAIPSLLLSETLREREATPFLRNALAFGTPLTNTKLVGFAAKVITIP